MAALSLLIAAAAAAQTPTPTLSDTVRLTVNGRRTVYQFDGLRGDTLLARAGSESLAVPVWPVDLVEVGERRPGGGMRVVKLGAIGLVVGAALGAGTFLAMDQIFGDDLPSCDEARDFQWRRDPDVFREALIRSAVVGGLVAAGYGAVAGGKDYWVWTPLEQGQLRVGLRAGSVGPALGM